MSAPSRLRRRLGPRGVLIYRAGTNVQSPRAGLNRYPSGVIGAWLRIPGHRILSVVWRRAR